MSRSRTLRRARARARAGRQLLRTLAGNPRLARELLRGVGRARQTATPVSAGAHQPPAWLEEFAAVATASRALPAPPGSARELLADVSRFPEWLTMHAGFRGETPTQAVPGLEFVQQARIMGIPADVRWTVEEVAELTVTLRGAGPMGVRLGFALEVEPAVDGCVVHFDAAIDGQPVKGPLGASIVRSLNDELDASLEALERLLASSGTRPVLHRASGTMLPGTTPVLVGVGQLVQREPNLGSGGDPVGLAVEALRRAAADAGRPELLAEADTVLAVPSASWRYADAAALAAERVGASPRRTVASSPLGGDGAQLVVNHAAQLIADGEAQVALLVGAEAGASMASAAGVTPGWPVQDDAIAPSEVIGVDRGPNNHAETSVGLGAPIFMYSLIESAVRRKAGETPDEHRRSIGRLWSRFSDVAAGNPYAWSPTALDAAGILEPGPGNRMVSEPYTKLLCANLQVDLATGLVMCSAAAAEAAGIPQEKWVFLHAGASGQDEWFVSERADLAASPAIRELGRVALDHTGVTIDEVAHVDLYSCFPSAVQITAAELGLPTDDPDRPLTVTGGLTFAGGPGNNYGSHAVASLVPLLRADASAYGLSTSLGWYATKHALGVYSAQPPARPFQHLKPAIDHPPARRALTTHEGDCVVEAFTIPYDREGEPEAVVISALTDDGNRLLLRRAESELVAEFLAADPLGWTLTLDADGALSVRSRERANLPEPPAPPVLVEQRGAVTVITLNRPEVRNAVDARTAKLLERAIDRFEADSTARVAIITGAGGAFCSGMDLKAAARGELPYGETRGPLGIAERPPTKPVIAAVDGPALAGGCELALAADLIVASGDSVFGIPEPKRGLVAAAGGVMRLAERLPRNIAMELALTGDPMPARRMAELGLVNELAPAGKVLETALDLAARIAVNAPLSVEASKRIVLEAADWPREEAFQRQTELATPALVSQDATEGVLAFAEKREPVWQGR